MYVLVLVLWRSVDHLKESEAEEKRREGKCDVRKEMRRE